MSMLRSANTDRDRGTPGAYVIGDPEFVRSVLEKDREKRLQIARHRLERVSIEDLAARFAAGAGVTLQELRRRARGNHRAAARKVFAYICHRLYGFTIVDVAHYLGCTHSPMSLSVKHGEELAGGEEFSKVLKALRP